MKLYSLNNLSIGLAAAIYISLNLAASTPAQDNLGTSMGIPNSSPGVLWPRVFSLESLGGNRLYPNGPEFGLSNTSGGFGMSGSGRITGVGLAERTVPALAQEEMNRPFASFKHVTDSFNNEKLSIQNTFSSSLSNHVRAGIQAGYSSAFFEYTPSISPVERLSNLDAILQDKPATPDSVLKTGL